jgi:hypothetical protein
MLFCVFPRSIRAETKIDYFKNTPLMRYGILATYYYKDRTFIAWHSLTNNVLADVMVLYYYDDVTEDIYEVKKLWLTKKPEGF